MKIIVSFLLIFAGISAFGQKFALIDKNMAQPITYTNELTGPDMIKAMFPVEKEKLPEFIKALEEIAAKLSPKQKSGKARDYTIGCTQFTGVAISLLRGDRLDYVIISDCGPTTVTMHLSDSKRTNTSNAYFINTWIKYIKSNL